MKIIDSFREKLSFSNQKIHFSIVNMKEAKVTFAEWNVVSMFVCRFKIINLMITKENKTSWS